ncbi:MAG TPA: LptE family protein [Chitinophagaceae bacterium]|nr:LptE family protein [Chitinophagaceae bacterium]
MIKKSKIIFSLLIVFSVWLSATLNTGCGIYKMADISIPDSIKTVRVNPIDNKARYINPQLSPQFTNKLRQKIVSQTRLTQVSNENAHYDISGWISQYDVSTSAISGQQVATNRLTVGVHISILNRLSTERPKEFEISRSFDFSATLTLAQAEARLLDEIIRNLSDEVFNRIFSDW